MNCHHLSSKLASLSLAIASVMGVSTVMLAPHFTISAIAQEFPPTVTTTSSPSQIALAKHLKEIGAKLYTAYWCPHCHSQKQRFGQEAVKQIEVIECDPRGVKPQTQLCRSNRIRYYPTWEINSKFYPGGYNLENIADFSKYRGNL